MSTISSFNADCARVISESDPVVYNEIDFIMREIIKKSMDGDYTAEIKQNTYMTDGTSIDIKSQEVGDLKIDKSGNTILDSSSPATEPEGLAIEITIDDAAPTKYYQVWRDEEEDRKAQIQLNSVVKYFRNLGFNIYIRQNSDTEKIKWVVNW